MFKQALALAAVSAYASAYNFGKISEEAGYFEGLYDGLRIDEKPHAMKETSCSKPNPPKMLDNKVTHYALEFWPMAKEMVASTHNGKTPKWVDVVEEVAHRFSLIAAIAVGTYLDSSYCRGAVFTYELKAIINAISGLVWSYLPHKMGDRLSRHTLHFDLPAIHWDKFPDVDAMVGGKFSDFFFGENAATGTGMPHMPTMEELEALPKPEEILKGFKMPTKAPKIALDMPDAVKPIGEHIQKALNSLF